MQTENHTIQAIIDGDTEQYRNLVSRYQTGLIIHCEHIVRNRADAEDIAQESFIKAYSVLHSFDPRKAKFSTWLYRIATNKAIDHLRKSKKTMNVEDIQQLADTTMPVQLPSDEIAAIRRAVAVLEPPVYSKVVTAYFWEGKSYQQIAQEMNVTTSTVGTWMRRAKLALKEEIA
jgi:RNA polymerase sigma-70 factor, ECF subfamily